MPIVTYHLVAGQHDDADLAALLQHSCRLFAEVLECPVDRVRAFVVEHRPELACLGGEMASAGAPAAPYVHFMLLEGRPLEHARRLLAGFTDLLVEHLDVDRARVRGGMWPVEPQRWAIGGVDAATLRAEEIAARQQQSRT